MKLLLEEITAIERDAGCPLGLLVIDTQSRTLDGDENTTKDGAKYAKAIELIRRHTSASLWIIAHTGHAEDAQDRPRGNSSLLGAYDTFYKHEKINETRGLIKITIDRDGLGQKVFFFTVELYDTGATNEDGEPVMVPWIEFDDRGGGDDPPPVDFTFENGPAPTVGRPKKVELGADDLRFLADMHAYIATGRPLSAHAQAPNYAPKELAKPGKGKPARITANKVAMRNLFDAGAIRAELGYRGTRHIVIQLPGWATTDGT